MLAVACLRWRTQRPLSPHKLIARAGARVIVPELTDDRPQHDAVGLMEWCDILFPDRLTCVRD